MIFMGESSMAGLAPKISGIRAQFTFGFWKHVREMHQGFIMSDSITNTQKQAIGMILRSIAHLESDAAQLEVITDCPQKLMVAPGRGGTFTDRVQLPFRSNTPPSVLLSQCHTLPEILIACNALLFAGKPVDASASIQELINLGILKRTSLNLDEIPRRLSWRLPNGIPATIRISSIDVDNEVASYTVIEGDRKSFHGELPLEDNYHHSPGNSPEETDLQLCGIQLTELGWGWLRQLPCEDDFEDLMPSSVSEVGAADASAQSPQPNEGSSPQKKGRTKGKSALSIREKIRGHFGNGKTRIPAFEDLAKKYRCSKSTAHKAIKGCPELAALCQSQRRVQETALHQGEGRPIIDRSNESREMEPSEAAIHSEETTRLMQGASEKDRQRLQAMSPEERRELEQMLRSPVD